VLERGLNVVLVHVLIIARKDYIDLNTANIIKCQRRGTLHRKKPVFMWEYPKKLHSIYLDERHPEPEVCDAVGGEEWGRVPSRPGAGETTVVLPARLCGGGQGGPPPRPQDPTTEPQAPTSRQGCPPTFDSFPDFGSDM
jgi:hypothetical protein